MRREHDLQAALAPVFPPVPEMVAYCGDEDVIGSEFYVMERIEGTILRRDLPDGARSRPCRPGNSCAATRSTPWSGLHDVDLEAAGLARPRPRRGLRRRQVEGWSGRFRRARTPDVGDFESDDGLARRAPAGRPPHVLVHNDFRFDNLVLDLGRPPRVVGVLDWELATVGDPLMDLGSALAYWVQADDDPALLEVRRQPTHTPGMLTRAEVVERYAARSGSRSPPPSGSSTRCSAHSGWPSSPSRSTTGSTTARRATRPSGSSATSCASSTTAAPPCSPHQS